MTKYTLITIPTVFLKNNHFNYKLHRQQSLKHRKVRNQIYKLPQNPQWGRYLCPLTPAKARTTRARCAPSMLNKMAICLWRVVPPPSTRGPCGTPGSSHRFSHFSSVSMATGPAIHHDRLSGTRLTPGQRVVPFSRWMLT